MVTLDPICRQRKRWQTKVDTLTRKNDIFKSSTHIESIFSSLCSVCVGILSQHCSQNSQWIRNTRSHWWQQVYRWDVPGIRYCEEKKKSKGQMHSPRSCSSEMFEIKMDATRKCSHLSLNRMDVACVDNDADNVKEVMELLIGLVSGPQNYPGLALCWGRLWKRWRMENESHSWPQPNTLTKKRPGIGNIQEIHLVKPLWTYIVHIHQAISFSSKRGAKKLRLAVCYPWLKEQQNGVWTMGRNMARSLIPLKSLI